jgi:hypothetical protein
VNWVRGGVRLKFKDVPGCRQDWFANYSIGDFFSMSRRIHQHLLTTVNRATLGVKPIDRKVVSLQVRFREKIIKPFVLEAWQAFAESL